MEEAKIKTVENNEVDLWLMDDRVPYDPTLLEGFVVPKEMEEAFDEIIKELETGRTAVSAA